MASRHNSGVEVAIASCVHYRGFRYGGFPNHLYADYTAGLAGGGDLEALRRQFVRRLLGLRADHFGATLGIALSRRHANWDFPWNTDGRVWTYTAATNPDPVCHTAADGILASAINREFAWHEQAFASIRDHGYEPDTYSYIRVLALIGRTGTRYLVLDGNHRLAALAVLGHTRCRVQVNRRWYLREVCAPLWFGTLFRGYTVGDARRVFRRYFREDNPAIPESTDYGLIVPDEPLQVTLGSGS